MIIDRPSLADSEPESIDYSCMHFSRFAIYNCCCYGNKTCSSPVVDHCELPSLASKRRRPVKEHR